MKPQDVEKNIQALNKVANRIINDIESEEEEDSTEDSDEETVDEIKRLIVNLLNGTEMSTPELRRYFKLSNTQIWKIMYDLENSHQIKRTDKKEGRAVVWTAN
ncbi:MAG: hypothetical protein GF353_08235 [Candidatus Lokiarchaeota archaeon]|nr:hypothetical protein [Candidatus Lokiarchaeota archaeon]